jgi:predicted MFS family arabinose efflux permease
MTLLTRNPWGVLAVLVVIHVLAHVDRNVLLGFSPQITRELQLSDTQFGFLVGAVWVLSFGVMALIFGSLADRFSRPRIIAVGMLVWSVCTAASGLAESFGGMVAGRFFVATGEAALVPAATGLLTEIFDPRRRGTAIGIFFVGIPLGIGLAFVLSGTLGSSWGWRGTFMALGGAGIAISLAVALMREDRTRASHERGHAFLSQMQATLRALSERREIALTIAGFVLVHAVFVGFAFLQLWLVRERGLEAGSIARQVGLVQMIFGTLGAVVGGSLGDRLCGKLRGGHATFMAMLVAICVPLVVALRLSAPGSAFFFAGLAAMAFLPLSLYGSALAIIQGGMPVSMRSTVAGFTMMCINVIAIACGNLAAGAASDALARWGYASPLTAVLLGLDALAACSIVFFLAAAKRTRAEANRARELGLEI